MYNYIKKKHFKTINCWELMKTAKNIWVLFFCSWISIWIEGNSIKKILFLIWCLKWKLHCIINRILYITSRKKIFNLMYHFWPFFFLIFIRFLCSYYWINKVCYTDKSCMLMEEPIHIWLHYWHLIEQETLITITAICMVSM